MRGLVRLVTFYGKTTLIFGLVQLLISLPFVFSQDREYPRPHLTVSENNRFLQDQNGQPFFWLGGTSWGMSEWLDRQDINLYLDDRQQKSFNVIQICLFWGKRRERPTTFTVNPANAYGDRAFRSDGGEVDVSQPAVRKGGSPTDPNDYWDHVEFILEAAWARQMMVAILPVWGRRYVNATHKNASKNLFSMANMHAYGQFLGERFRTHKNIIWVLGGDVKADHGGDYRAHYRSMAEGILLGITGEEIAYHEESILWDAALMTYHPDGSPMVNSSAWFHDDPWLDFNMIETFVHRDSIYKAVQQDYLLHPAKPTLLAEPAYEGSGGPGPPRGAAEMRRQAFQAVFSGAAGFTYGGYFGEDGQGPLFSPTYRWQELLDLEGAHSMVNLSNFCRMNHWEDWIPVPEVMGTLTDQGAFHPLTTQDTTRSRLYLYFPSRQLIKLKIPDVLAELKTCQIKWFNPTNNTYSDSGALINVMDDFEMMLPAGWEEGIAILKFNE